MWNLDSSCRPSQRKSLSRLINLLAMLVGNGKRDKMYIGGLDKVLLTRVRRTRLDKSKYPIPNGFWFKRSTQRETQYFRGRDEMIQLRISANSSLCGTSPTTTNPYFRRLTFKPQNNLKAKENVTQIADLITIRVTHNKCIICEQNVGYFQRAELWMSTRKKPKNYPPTISLENILLRASMTITKRRGEKGSSWEGVENYQETIHSIVNQDEKADLAPKKKKKNLRSKN